MKAFQFVFRRQQLVGFPQVMHRLLVAGRYFGRGRLHVALRRDTERFDDQHTVVGGDGASAFG